MLETVRIGQEHDPDLERAEAELAAAHDRAGAANRPAAMADAELRLHDEELRALLLLAELLDHRDLARGLAELARTELPVAVVVEPALALLGELREDEHHRLAVGRRDVAPVEEGEVALRPACELGRERGLVVGNLDAEGAAQDVALRLERRGGAVARQVAVARLDLLVGELVGHGVLLDQGDEPLLEVAAALDEPLKALLGDAGKRLGGRVLDEPQILLPLAFGQVGRDRVARHRRILLLPRTRGTPYRQPC